MLQRQALNPPKHIYPIDPWRIVEKQFYPRFLEQGETIFTLSNGYLGMRGCCEEGTPAFENGTYINGFFETWPICYGEEAHGFAKESQTIVNVPDTKLVKLSVDDESFLLPDANLVNFDFFRTINSRFVTYPHCLMAIKTSAGITVEPASGIKNVFVKDWKPKFFTDPRKKIASIPFLRNLIEFTKGENDPDYAKLTSLLHWRADSSAITEADLNAIYNNICGPPPTGTPANGTKPVVDIIQAEASSCLKAGGGINFENKIVLAIAIRIGAEQFMVKKINDPKFVAGIEANQTQTLLQKFRDLFGGDNNSLEVLDRVLLMTPENIHLNSFMYEPIVDMSDDHLRKLYQDVLSLS